MKNSTCIFLLFVFMLSGYTGNSADIIVKSPDGKISLNLFSNNGQLSFKVNYLNMPVLLPSPVLYKLDGKSITEKVIINQTKKNLYKGNETYEWYGVHSLARNQFNGQKIEISSQGFVYTIDTRVFNDGAAFRFIIPGKNDQQRVPDETTVFNFASSNLVWYHDLNSHYESEFQFKKMNEVPEGAWMAPPVTVKFFPMKLAQGAYASVSEAALLHYPGMALQSNGKNGMVMRLAHDQPTSYPYKLRYSPEDTLRLRIPASLKGEITTPWRVVIVGKDLNDLVNNDIINNLNAPPDPTLFPKGMKTDWIRPGRAVWKYLDDSRQSSHELMKHYADQAGKLGFEHNILEGFWSRWTDDQIKELVNYSKEKGVSVWFWKHSKSLRNAAHRDSFFKRCHDLGVAGVKIDFFDHEALEVINLYEDIFIEAAKYKLLLDFHGANKPTGLFRTFPHELTREAVKGMEASRVTDRATLETTIPFTRQIVGPAEYTVMHFGTRRANTTWAHQIASAAILSAPLLTYAANPDSIVSNPAVDIIKNIPANWDETRVLNGSEIGQLAIFARRKGSTWFLAVMNGKLPKKIRIPLTFLKEGNYKAKIAMDVPGISAAVKMEERNYHSKDFIHLDLEEGGGYIAEFNK